MGDVDDPLFPRLVQVQNPPRLHVVLESLFQSRKEWIVNVTHSQHAMRALDFLFGNPIFSGSLFVEHAGMPVDAARRILKACSVNGLLDVLRPGSGRRAAVYQFPDLLKITEG